MLLFFLVLLGVIVKQEVAAVSDWIEQWLHPDQWAMQQQCDATALAQASHPDYARIVDSGQVHKTANGYYVADVLVGERGAQGELTFRFHCYFDHQLSLNSSGRQ